MQARRRLCMGGVSRSSHPRVDAYGCVDELNAALGVARVTAADEKFISNELLAIQKELILVMGELATAPEDLAALQQRWLPAHIRHNGRSPNGFDRRSGEGQTAALQRLGDSGENDDLRRARCGPHDLSSGGAAGG